MSETKLNISAEELTDWLIANTPANERGVALGYYGRGEARAEARLMLAARALRDALHAIADNSDDAAAEIAREALALAERGEEHEE